MDPGLAYLFHTFYPFAHSCHRKQEQEDLKRMSWTLGRELRLQPILPFDFDKHCQTFQLERLNPVTLPCNIYRLTEL